MSRLKLHWQIAIAIGLAIIAGWLTGDHATVLGITFYSIYDFVGTIFISALTMLIVPLITSSIIVGVAGIGATANLGRLGGKTLLIYTITSLLAVLVGLFMVNLVQPGIIDGKPARDLLALGADATVVAEQIGDRGIGAVVEIFVRMVPTNVVQAAAEGQMLGLIFFSILFGYFMTRIDHSLSDTLYRFWDGVFHVMMRMTEWVMVFAPVGVFGLVAMTVAQTGLGAALPLVIFALTVVAALIIHSTITIPVMLRTIARVPAYSIFPAMAPALLTAFSTASSSATLPITMDCLEKKAGVSRKVTSFVLPLGATVNMDGTALYECVAAIFIAQAYGLELSFGVQFVIVITALVTSIGVAGIPSASLVAIAIILSAVGLPVEALGVLFVFDRILDMIRTSTNVLGDASAAVIVARLEGEEGILEAGASASQAR